MAIAVDSVGAGNRTTGSSTTLATSWSHTIVDTHACVVVGVTYSVSTNAVATAPTVTYGGVQMRLFNDRQVGATTVRAGIATYILLSPPTGAQTVSVTCAGSGTKVQVAGQSIAYTGVAAIRSVTDTTATGQTVTTVSGDVVFSVTSNDALISAVGGTSRFISGVSTAGAGDWIAVQDQNAVGTSTVVSVTGTSTTPAVASVVLNPASAAPAGQSVAFDAAGAWAKGTTSVSFSHTSSGSNLAVVVGVSTPAAITPTATFGGVSMISLGSATDTGAVNKVTIFYLLRQPAGTQTLTVTATASSWCTVQSVSFTGVAAVNGFVSNTTGTAFTAASLVVPAALAGGMAFTAGTWAVQPFGDQLVSFDHDGSVDLLEGIEYGNASGVTFSGVWANFQVIVGCNIAAETGTAPTPFQIPNRNVGPMALRQAFRRADQWTSVTVSGDFTGSTTSTDVTVGLTAGGVVGTTSASTTTALTVGLTAAGVVGTVSASTATAITVGLTAAGAVGTTSASTSTALTVGLTAAGVVGTTSASTATALTVGLTAAGVVGTTSASTATALTVGLTAAGVVGTVSAATSTDLTVGLTADGTVFVVVGETGTAPIPFQIPNKYVGPMALRQAFRRTDRWTAGPESYNGAATSSDLTVGLSAAGVVGTVSSATTAITVGLTAAGVVGTSSTATTALTVGLTAAGVVGTSSASTTTALTVGLTATGVVALSQTSTSTALTVGLTAAGAVGVSQTSTATALTVGLTAAGVVGTTSASTATALTVGLTAAGIVGTTSTASTAVTVGLTADGVVGLVGAAQSTDLSIGLTADGINPSNVTPAAPAPFQVPNKYVGPMALRNAFRRADLWQSQLTALIANAQSTDTTVGLTATGAVGTTSASTTTAVTVGLTAAGIVGVVGQASTAITVGLTAAGGGNVVSGANTAITVGLSAVGTMAAAGSASTAITVGLTAAGVVGTASTANTAITVGLTAVGTMAATSTASTAVTVGLTAAGVVKLSGSATNTAVTVGLTAAGVVGTTSTTTTSVTVGLTAAGVVGTVSQTTTSVTVGITANGFVGLASTSTTDLTVGLTADGFIISAFLHSGADTAAVVGLSAAGAIQIFTNPQHTVGANATTRTTTADGTTRGVAVDITGHTGDASASTRGGIADATTRETNN